MILIIDIGHQNYSLDDALSILETKISQALHENNARAVQVVHGHGSGALRKAVRNWCQTQTGRFKAVIPGEEYDMFHKDSMEMRVACELPEDPNLGRRNQAVTYIWLW